MPATWLARTLPPPPKNTSSRLGGGQLRVNLVDLRFSSWNPLMKWLRNIEAIKASE